MRKTVSLLLLMTFILSAASSTGAAAVSSQIVNPSVGKVVEVFDTDAIAVRLFNGQIAYVKLLGVNGSTHEGGLKYMQDNAFGRNVTLIPDYTGSVTAMDGRWNLMYVYLSTDGTTNTNGREFFNQSLIKFGYAEADEKRTGISQYAALLTEQKNAKSSKLGMWGDGLTGYYSSSDRVNVNTASTREIAAYMTGNYPDSLLSNITAYRSYTPYSSVEELKYVNGMTRDIFSENRHIFTVITNINTASENELKTLNSYYDEDIDYLMEYRSSEKFTNLTDLYRKADVSRDFYDGNRYYISVDDKTKMVYAKPDKIVNINTATESQLASISDVGSSLASRIVGARRNGYTLKTLMEIKEIYSISDSAVHRLSDNCHLYTDINSASRTELESLFGNGFNSTEINNIVSMRDFSNITKLKNVLSDERYNRIEKYVYADEISVPERINLNTASEGQLREIGMSYTEATRIVSANRKMRTASQIPISVTNYDKNVALFTNINTASLKELRSLNAFSETVMSLIISARNEQPFGSKDELYDFFEEQNQLSAYRSVSDFIVVR